VAEPARIAREPGILPALAPLVDAERFQQFTERAGFDPRETSDLVVAGFELGTLYLLSAPERGPQIEQAFRDRLLRGEVIEQPHPALTRIQGVAGTRPQALLHARDRLVAVAVDDLRLVRFVEGYLLGRFRKTPPALAGAALRDHADFAAAAPLRLWIPGSPGAGPLDDLPDARSGVTATLAGAEFVGAKGCACEGGGADPVVRLHLAVAGPWEPADTRGELLETLWRQVVDSPTGHLLALDRPLRPPSVEVVAAGTGARIELHVDYLLRPLVHRLRGVLAGSLEELFSSSDAPPGPPREAPSGGTDGASRE
jgi:hypothetical protein